MKPTKQIIEEELRKTLLAWINKSDVNYRLADNHHGAGWTVDVEDLLSQVLPRLNQVAEAAREEERENVLKIIDENTLNKIEGGEAGHAYANGFWDCKDQVKTLISNNQKDE